MDGDEEGDGALRAGPKDLALVSAGPACERTGGAASLRGADP